MVYECLRLPYQSAFHVYVKLPYMDPKGYGKTRSSKYRTVTIYSLELQNIL